jgi:hypothetical protein
MKKSKLTELLETLYVKYGNTNITELYKSQIAQIVKEEIARVSKILKRSESVNESIAEGFDKVEHMKLLNKALRAMPGSKIQKDLIKQLNVIRKDGGMKPLKEQGIINYGQNLHSTITEEKVYIDYLNKKKGFKQDRIKFKSYEDAVKWAKKNFEKFNPDMIKYESVTEEAKRDYKKEYAKYGKSEKSKKYRAELNKYNRDKNTYGNGDGKDASHKGGKIVGFESESKNRGRAEKSRLKKT